VTLLHCLENGVSGARPTDDGDVVLDVWSRRDAVRIIGTWLQDSQGLALLETADGFGYRYARGDTILALLVPEGLDRQRTQPSTPSRTSPALSIDGGSQALLRVERVPVLPLLQAQRHATVPAPAGRGLRCANRLPAYGDQTGKTARCGHC
jgi:hypothetical protein